MNHGTLTAPTVPETPVRVEHAGLIQSIHQELIREIDLDALAKLPPERSRASVEATARALLTRVGGGVHGETKEAIIEAVVDEAIGLGPIQSLVQDPSISEVMINGYDEVYFERDGIICLSPARFRDDAHVMRVIDRIIAPIGRRVDESSPYVDARLPDGSRVNVVIPPVIPRGPTVTIRKFRPERYRTPELIENETLTKWLADFLRACIRLRLNTVISGGTGTGKTTLLNAVSAFIPSSERIITIEDPVELQVQQQHVIRMEARPANIEGRNEVTQRDLVRNALRMRPDRIIVGEVRGPEAFDMMQAMNTGHEGSLTTVHANSTRDALARIENMILMAGLELPIKAIREQIGSALHLMVHLSRFTDGRRRVVSVAEITGMEGDVVTMQEIFKFQQSGVDDSGHIRGALEPTGIRPVIADAFESAGIPFHWEAGATTSWG